MKSKISYTEAYSKLEELVEQLEEGDIQLDQLSAKVKQANELIVICEGKLRNIRTEIDEAAKSISVRPRGKK